MDYCIIKLKLSKQNSWRLDDSQGYEKRCMWEHIHSEGWLRNSYLDIKKINAIAEIHNVKIEWIK